MLPGYNDGWAIGPRTTYPDNLEGRTRLSRLDYIFGSKSPRLRLQNFRVLDTRDMTRRPTLLLGTLDDRGLRPSDHNWVIGTYEVQ